MCDAQKVDSPMKEAIRDMCGFISPIQPVSLVAFESGHYKKVTGQWKGDSVWAHFIKPDGKQVHINKNKVEYIEEM